MNSVEPSSSHAHYSGHQFSLSFFFVGSGCRFQGLLDTIHRFLHPKAFGWSYNRVFVGGKFLTHYRVDQALRDAASTGPRFHALAFETVHMIHVTHPLRKVLCCFHIGIPRNPLIPSPLTAILIAFSLSLLARVASGRQRLDETRYEKRCNPYIKRPK